MGARWILRFLGPKLELPSMSAYSPMGRVQQAALTISNGALQAGSLLVTQTLSLRLRHATRRRNRERVHLRRR